jgi:C-terminal processing protease CtpA/Prc
LAGVKGIIFDIRNYPYETETALSGRLCEGPFIMARITLPDLNYPGVFRFEKNRLHKRTNRHSYKGQVVLLADEISVSHSEWALMTLQASTRTTTIGSTTAGQDGNISQRIILPGGLFTRFSTMGVYYPDGTPAQRTGVRIDVTVNPTIRGLQEGKDEVLEAGINFIKEH